MHCVLNRMGWFLLLTLALASRIFGASFCTNDPVQNDTRQRFELLAGYSPVSTTLIGTTTRRQFVLAGFEYGYRCWAWRSTSVSFSPGILPAAVLLQPSEYVYNNANGSYGYRLSPSHAVYGFAVLPIGFTFDFVRKRVIHPFSEIRGGLVASTEPIPVNTVNATGLNFIFDFGGGVDWRIAERRALSLGYKFLHISNAYTTSTNPGVDNNVFYIGFSFLR